MAQQMEDALDDELHKMNNMTEDDLEDIRRKRLEAMKAGQTKRKEWLAKGHGELRSLADEKEFFAEMKGEDKMVVHFYRNNWPCKVMDMHLDLLSRSTSRPSSRGSTPRSRRSSPNGSRSGCS